MQVWLVRYWHGGVGEGLIVTLGMMLDLRKDVWQD